MYDSRVLEYFIDNSKKKLQGQIELTGSEDLKIDGDAGKHYSYGFFLETDSRTYKFAVKNADQRAMWISALRDVISGNISKKIEARRKGGNHANSPHTAAASSNPNSNQGYDGAANESLQQMNGNQTHERTQSQGFEKFTSYDHSDSVVAAASKSAGDIAAVVGVKAGIAARNSIEKNDNNNNNTNSNNANKSNSNLNNSDDNKELELENGSNELNENNNNVLPPRLSNFAENENEMDENDSETSNINLLLGNNPKVLECLVSFLIDDCKNDEFSKLLQINKSFRNHLSINSSFFDNYTTYIYPKHVLKRFSDKRSQARPWIMAHDYKQIWVFGNVERVKIFFLFLCLFVSTRNFFRLFRNKEKWFENCFVCFMCL